jgi:hypothetical protein
LARGYDHPSRPAVPFSQIYLRPAGNLHTSARELGVFVQMLLNWGETAEHLVIDPEYLSNMERPRTSLSARSGLIYGYGSGIASQSIAGFPVLGHGGGIDGFLSFYGYSAARDAGWVVLVNATYAPAALERLSELAVRYLKHDVEPPPRPEHHPAAEVLGRYAGYYQNMTPRNAILGAFENVLGGESVTPDGNALLVRPFLGRPEPLIPVSDTLFRRRDDVTPSRVFATDEEGQPVMLGDGYYGVRRSRWRVELLRGALALAAVILATAPLAMIVWLVRARRTPAPGFWPLKITITLLPAALAACFAIAVAPAREWGMMNTWTRLTFVGSWAVPLLAMVTLVLTASALQRDARPWFALYTTTIAVSALAIAAYMAVWGLVGLRPWAY